MLEDLVAAAVNDAINRVNRLKQEKMAALTGGINYPPDSNCRFETRSLQDRTLS